jgi:hypothetical protein
MQQINAREKDSQDYIQTQARLADVLIQIKPKTAIKTVGDAAECISLSYTLFFSNSVYVEDFMDTLAALNGLHIQQSYENDDRQKINIEGAVDGADLKQIVDDWIPELEALGINPCFESSELGVIVAVLLFYIFEERKYVH